MDNVTLESESDSGRYNIYKISFILIHFFLHFNSFDILLLLFYRNHPNEKKQKKNLGIRFR